MQQCLFCSYPFFWQIGQHFQKQIQKIGFVIYHFESFFQVRSLKISKRVKQTWIKRYLLFVLCNFLTIHRSQYPKNGKQLIALCLPLEKRCQQKQFRHNAPHRPHINSCGIFSQAQHQFRSPIISRNNVRCILPLRIEDFTTTKIANLDNSLRRQQHIFWFEITMRYIFLMNPLQSIQQLKDILLKQKENYLDVDFRELSFVFDCFLDQILKVVLYKLEDYILNEFALIVL